MMASGSNLNVDATHAEDLRLLSRLIGKPVTTRFFEEWLQSIKDRLIFKGTILGSIRWLKTSPTMLTPNHADAFVLRLSHTQRVLAGTPGGDAQWITLIAPNNPPSKWSGPDDDEFFRVSFMTSGLQTDVEYTLAVEFSPAAQWASPSLRHTHHVIEPPSRLFKINDVSLLDPFEVTTRLF